MCSGTERLSMPASPQTDRNALCVVVQNGFQCLLHHRQERHELLCVSPMTVGHDVLSGQTTPAGIYRCLMPELSAPLPCLHALADDQHTVRPSLMTSTRCCLH